MGEWRLALIEDLCRRVTSGGTPARSHPEYFADGGPGHPWVKSSELRDGRIRRTEEKITDLGLENSAAKLLDPGAVLVAMYGATAGKVGFLLTEAALNQAICALVPDADRADSAFLFYALRAQYETLSSSTAGAAQQNLNAGTIKALSILVPDLCTQRRISALLSAIDDLIELNERRIELLEDLARSLYREWFVHFRHPGSQDIEMVDSAMGRIPVGWEVQRIDELASTITRGIAPKYAENGGWVVLNQRCIRDRRVDLTLARRHEGNVPNAKRVQKGDVLINSTGVGTLGRVAVLLEEQSRLTVDSHVTAVRVESPTMHAWFGLSMLDQEPVFQAMGTGSTGQTELRRAAVGKLPILVPPEPILAAFDKLIRPLFQLLPVLHRAQHELARSRDLLLPRLVTGQLDISDVDLGALVPSAPE